MSLRAEIVPLTSRQVASWNKSDPTRVVDLDDAPGSSDPGRPLLRSHDTAPPPMLDTDGFPVVGAVVAGFILERELGRGSFGRAFLARQEDLAGRPVVLKFSPAVFVSEAHTLARLQHTNIVPIFS